MAIDPLKTQAERWAEKFEPQVAKAVMAWLNAQHDAVSLVALVQALQSGDGGKVLAVIAAAQAAPGAAMTGAITNALQDTLWGAGALGVQMASPSIGKVEFHFDRVNPALGSWLQTYSLGLIREIDTGTRESVRTLLAEQMNKGEGPLASATKIKDVIGLTERQARAVLNFRKELQGFHTKRSAATWNLGGTIDRLHGMQVLKPDAHGRPQDGMLDRRLRDFRFDGALQKTLTTGKPLSPAQIDKMVAAYARKYLAYRARVIARTESLRTTNAGIMESFRQAIEAGKVDSSLVKRVWIVADDERLCEICAPIPKLNKGGVSFYQPFNTPLGPVSYPPIHPQCRCTIFCRIVEAPLTAVAA